MPILSINNAVKKNVVIDNPWMNSAVFTDLCPPLPRPRRDFRIYETNGLLMITEQVVQRKPRRSLGDGGLMSLWITLLTTTMLIASCTSDKTGEQALAVETTKAAATVDFDESYVVIGLNSVLIRGKTEVHSGNIGVSNDTSRYPEPGADCIYGSDL